MQLEPIFLLVPKGCSLEEAVLDRWRFMKRHAQVAIADVSGLEASPSLAQVTQLTTIFAE
jgi:hypothetical protein